MNLTKKLALGLTAGALTIGAGATAFAASPSTSERGAFVCAHLDEVTAQQQAHLDLLNGRLRLLQEADDAAEAGGHDGAAAKIEARITRTNERIVKVTARQGKLDTWAASHCATPGG